MPFPSPGDLPNPGTEPASLVAPALTGGFFTAAPAGKPQVITNIKDFQFSSVQSLSRVRFFATPWNAAHQALLSMGLPRQEYWSGLPFPSPGDLPNPGIEPTSPVWQADSFHCTTWEASI